MKSAFEPELWQQRYEALRQHVLSGRDTLAAPPLGLRLLRHQGVAGWMMRWSAAAETSVVAAIPCTAPSLLRETGWQQQLTLLLAQLTLPQIHPAMLP